MKAEAAVERFLKFGSVLGLERVSELLRRLGNPEKELRVIHVAGTNGKGSVSKYIYETLEESGIKTGLFTSPYIEKFNERIEFDRHLIPDDDLERITAQVIEKADSMTAQGLESPTEFEIITAIAFVYFKEQDAEAVILEVGLGGRGDSTNVIEKPEVAVFSSISYDHMDRLGNTIEEIAMEKAGIMKKGIPAVSGVNESAAEEVLIREAARVGCPLCCVDFGKWSIIEEKPGRTVIERNNERKRRIAISMTGRHQAQNAITALKAVDILRVRGFEIPEEAVRNGFEKAFQPARFEIISQNPAVIIDGAHNQGGAISLAETIKHFYGDKKILMVCGLLRDKDRDSILENFLNITDDFIATEPSNPRKLPKEHLGVEIEKRGGRVIATLSPEDATEYVKSQKAGEYDVIVFAGSLYLAGSIRRIW